MVEMQGLYITYFTLTRLTGNSCGMLRQFGAWRDKGANLSFCLSGKHRAAGAHPLHAAMQSRVSRVRLALW